MMELGIGTMVRFNCPPAESFKRLLDMGIKCCQLCAPPDNYLYGEEGRKNTQILRHLYRYRYRRLLSWRKSGN